MGSGQLEPVAAKSLSSPRVPHPSKTGWGYSRAATFRVANLILAGSDVGTPQSLASPRLPFPVTQSEAWSFLV